MKFKSCSNCSLFCKKQCVGSDDFCTKWLPKQASCMRCDNLLSCLKKDKDVHEMYVCKKFEKGRKFDSVIEARATLLDEVSEEESEDLFSPVLLVEEIIKSDFDPRTFALIDERDIPKAKNEIEFITDPKFLGTKLFARQLHMAVKFFSAACPYNSCTDTKFLNKKIQVDTNPDEILDRITLYKNGVCPKCKRNKHDAYLDGRLKTYTELAAVCGQRSGKCVRGDTVLQCSKGLLEFDELKPSEALGFHNFEVDIALPNSKKVTTSKFYVEDLCKTITVTLKNGYKITGTPEHPIYTSNGFVKLKELTEGTSIPIYLGQNLWGNKLLKLATIVSKANISIARINVRNKIECRKTGFLTKDIARLLGYLVSKGSYGRITNQDSKVLDDCYKVLVSLFGDEFLKRTDTDIFFRSTKIVSFIETLLGYKMNVGSARVFIPKCIRQSPRGIVIEFMRSLFEGDGGWNGDSIEYCTISERLKNHVSSVLHNLGIVHMIRYGKTWASNGTKNQISKDSYHIFIEGPELKNFRDIIGFLSVKKNKRLDKTIKKLENRQLEIPFWYDKCPNWMKNDFILLMKDVGNQLNKHKHKNGVNKLGINSIYGTTGTDKLKRMRKASNVPLTKQKIRYFIEPLLLLKEYAFKLKKDTLAALAELYVKCNQNLYYSEVVAKSYNPKEKTYDITVPKYHRFMANGLINHNTSSAVLFSAAILHNYLNLPDPSKFYNLLGNQALHATFVSLTFSQAYDNVWLPFQDLVINSNWFKLYIEFLDQEGIRLGKELYKIRDSFVAFTQKKIGVAASGPDKRKLRGKSRFISLVDEVSWFVASEGSIKFDPDEIYQALDNSLMTIRGAHKQMFPKHPNLPNAYGIYLSSPYSKTDKLMRMLQQAKSSDTICAFHLPTWEVNPNITKELLADKFRADPVAAERDFGANPPFSAAPYITQPALVIPSFTKRTNLIKVKSIETVKDSLGGRLIYPVIKIIRPPETPAILAIDLGYNNNSVAMTVMHYINKEKGMVGVSGILEIKPEPFPISFPMIYEQVITPIIEEFNIVLLSADRWQSIDLTQRVFKDFGIEGVRYSVTYQDFEDVRNKLLSGEFRFPKLEHDVEELLDMNKDIDLLIKDSPVSHLLLQMLLVKDTKRTVTKGDQCTDDILRAMVLGHALMTHDDYAHLFSDDDEQSTMRNWNINEICVIANKSSSIITSVPSSGIGILASRS